MSMSTKPTSLPPARPNLTDTEKRYLDGFVEALSASATSYAFCCGGVIKLPEMPKLSLFYKTSTALNDAKWVSFPTNNAANVQELVNASLPSSFGRGQETVYDESYRVARELPQDAFALNPDPLQDSDILARISHLTFSRHENEALKRCIYKLNSYGTGGFFKAHRDTPKSDRHVGSIVLALPSAFEGGQLRVSHEGKDVIFDWSSLIGTNGPELQLPWAFFFSDVEHEVLPVTSGTRLTIAYDVFAVESIAKQGDSLQGSTIPLYKDFYNLFKNSSFLPQGGRIAFGLSHTYPVNIRQVSNGFASHLKGSDAALYEAILSLDVAVELCVVYAERCDDSKATLQFPTDGYDPGNNGPDSVQAMYTSTNFAARGFDNEEPWESDCYEKPFVELHLGAKIEPDIIWARKPGQELFIKTMDYLAYGNEAHMASIYSAVAIVVEIPPFGEKGRQ